ncbi:DUF397 domain-containing protein [Cryptosporangium minutisporangium]
MTAKPKWHKSTYSAIGNCVEVTTAPINGLVGLRDTKDRGVELAFPTHSWKLFLDGAKQGEFSPEAP